MHQLRLKYLNSTPFRTNAMRCSHLIFIPLSLLLVDMSNIFSQYYRPVEGCIGLASPKSIFLIPQTEPNSQHHSKYYRGVTKFVSSNPIHNKPIEVNELVGSLAGDTERESILGCPYIICIRDNFQLISSPVLHVHPLLFARGRW